MTKTRNRYYNPNPKKSEKANDCVVRALCKATGNAWDDVYNELCAIGFEMKVMPTCKPVWTEYLNRNNFIQHKLSIKKGMKRPRVQSFASSNKSGTFVLQVAHHIVTCEDGYFYDTWDCGDAALYGYWEKPSA